MEEIKDDFNEAMKPESEECGNVILDFVDFINCVNTKVKPHNELLYNIIMNAFEMMVLRYENGDIRSVLLPNQDGQMPACESCGNGMPVQEVPEDIAAEVDSIVAELSAELEKEI